MTFKLHVRHFLARWLHSQSNQNFKIPLQVVLTIPFVVQVLGIVGLVGYLSYQSGQQAVHRLVQQLTEEVGDRVKLYITDYLKTPPLINRLNANAFQLGYLTPDRPEPIKQHFLQQLQEFNSTRVYFSNPQGGLISMGKDERGLSIAITDQLTQGTLSVYGVDRQGNRRQLLLQRPNYDARQRPFYRAAVTIGRPTWTPIFVYIPASRGLGIAASYPLYDSNRQLQGVLSSDLSLDAIHHFLKTLPLGPQGSAFIMERSGLLVAASTIEASLTDSSNPLHSEQNQQNQRIAAVNSPNPQIRTAARYLRSRFGNFAQISAKTHLSLDLDGDLQVLQVSPIRDELGLDWLLVTVVPESNFTTELEANLYRTALLCGLALVGSIGMGVWTSRRMARSLLRLTQATQAVAAGTLDRPLPATRLAEVSTLATSFRQMVSALQTADQLRQTYAADLERQVAEKTTALTEAQRIAQVGSWEFNVVTGRSTWSAEQFNIMGLDQALGEPSYPEILDFMPPDDRPVLQAAVQAAIEHGTPYTLEHRLIHTSGSIIYTISRGEAIKNEQGQVIKLIGTTANITDRKQMEIALRQSELTFATIFQDSPQAAWISNLANGHFLKINENFSTMMGYSKEEVLGKTCADLQFWTDLEALEYFRSVMASTGFIRDFEVAFRIKSGDFKTVILSACISRLADDDCMIGILSDITDRKRVERELHQAKEAAEIASQAKSTFLANMSHELRTPLNVILGFTSLLQRDSTLTPNQHNDLNRIYRSGEHLLRLINEVLELSKIEAGRLTLNPQKTNLLDLLRMVMSMFSHQAITKQLSLHFEPLPNVPTCIVVDAQKLEQVLINLIGNAIKFTKVGHIKLRVSSHSSASLTSSVSLTTDAITNTNPNTKINTNTNTNINTNTNTMLVCEVEDTGIGIAPQDLHPIFDDFVQAPTDRLQDGTGLGLAISRQLVQLMGGEITVDSQVGRGSTFRFAIPVAIATGETIQPQSPPRQIVGLVGDRTDYRILVVDDQAENRQLLVRLLSCLNLNLRKATNGIEAVTEWHNWQPHLIWMDLRMPSLDGYAATREIRTLEQQAQETQPGAPKVPSIIIAITAQGSENDQAMAIAAGCNDYMSKPFALDAPFQMMAKYLPLQYHYSEPQPDRLHTPLANVGHPNHPQPLDLSVMPQAWIAALHHAALTCSDHLITQLIQQIPTSHDYLARTLAQLTENFAFPEIMQLTQLALIERSSNPPNPLENSSPSMNSN